MTDTLFDTARYRVRPKAAAPWYERVPEADRWHAQTALVRAKARHDEMAEIMDCSPNLGELYAQMIVTGVLDCTSDLETGPAYSVVHASDLAVQMAGWHREQWSVNTVISESHDSRHDDSRFDLVTYIYTGQSVAGWALARSDEIFAHCETPL